MQNIVAKKLETKNIVFIVASFLVALLIATSLLWTPQVVLDCDVESFESISTFVPTDVDGLVNCTLDAEGNFVATDEDPYLIINNITAPGYVLMVNFKEPLSKDIEMEAFYNERWGFNEAQKVKKTIEKGSTYAYFVFSTTAYTDVRVDIGIDCKIESIELGNEGMIETNATSNPYWFISAFIFAKLIAGATYVLDQKKKVSEKIVVWFVEYKSVIIKSIFSLVVFGIIGAVVSVVICEVVNDVMFMSVKGLYTFVMVTAFVFFLLCGIACIWNYRKTLKEEFEKVFVMMTLIVGFGMIVIAPFAHLSWDIDSHYWWALETSYLGDAKLTQSDWLVTLPHEDTLIKDTADGNFLNMGILSFGYNDIVEEYSDGDISLPHFPSAVFLALGRLLGLPFVLVYMLGKVPNLLIYTGVCYLAMKQLKDGKLILAVIALFPTNLVLATNYSYDYWITSLSIFAMAYFIGNLQNRERKVDGKDAFIMSACFVLACLPKPIYFPLLLIPFLMPPKKIEDRKKYYLICMLLLVALLAVFFIRSMASTTGGGDTRGGSDVGPADQLAFVFGDIFGYAVILLRFLFTEYLTIANMEQYISHHAYLGVAGGSIVFIVLLVAVFLFDKEKAYTKETRSDWLNRIYVILMYFGGSALIASALYVSFTPVGHPTVLGCQARYIVPWLYPIYSIWAMNGIKPIVSNKVLTWAVVLGCYGMLFYNLATVFLPSVACLG